MSCWTGGILCPLDAGRPATYPALFGMVSASVLEGGRPTAERLVVLFVVGFVAIIGLWPYASTARHECRIAGSPRQAAP